MPQNKNILLIDDDEISNFLTGTLLKNSGFTQNIHICPNGAAALSLVQEKYNNTGWVPDIILLDITLPEQNGFDFLAAYHSLVRDKPAPVIIILTAWAYYQETEILQYYPKVEVFLHKPLTPESLQYIIGKYFGNAEAPVIITPAPAGMVTS